MGYSHEICGYTCEEGHINTENRDESPWYRNWRHIECPLWYRFRVCQTQGTSSHNKLHMIRRMERGKSIVFFIVGMASHQMWMWGIGGEVVKVETPYHDNDLVLTPIISPQSGWHCTWSYPELHMGGFRDAGWHLGGVIRWNSHFLIHTWTSLAITFCCFTIISLFVLDKYMA